MNDLEIVYHYINEHRPKYKAALSNEFTDARDNHIRISAANPRIWIHHRSQHMLRVLNNYLTPGEIVSVDLTHPNSLNELTDYIDKWIYTTSFLPMS